MSDGAPAFERKEAVIIVNPVAHNLPPQKRLQEADAWLREHGWKAEWHETRAPGDAIVLAARAAERGVPLVLVCGGDGAMNEAINGLAGSETAAGMIPAGTTSLWARELKLMRRPVQAVKLLVNGNRRRIDLGKAGARYFLSMAGYGIDAEVTDRVSLWLKDRVGAAAYALAAAQVLMSYRSSRVTVRLDGEEVQDNILMVLASNTRIYGGITKVASDAAVDDGLLDAYVFRGEGKPTIVTHAARALIRKHASANNVIHRKVKRLEFEWDTPLRLHLDGDPMPDSPKVLTVEPDALWVVTPRGLDSPLFSRPD